MSLQTGESKFGFKDKQKALETLSLLESHDMQYRKLTVRGLLGRAKRVLTLTKSPEKITNIKEAMEVLNNWLEENASATSKTNPKTVKEKKYEEDADDKDKKEEDKVGIVMGLGFKDKAAAVESLRILKGRDPEYQKLAVQGLIRNSQRVLLITKSRDKIRCIEDGVNVLKNFLITFEKENMMSKNREYLSYSVIEKLPKPDDKLAAEFLSAYRGPKAKGNYKHLRTMHPKSDNSTSWDKIRNTKIAEVLAIIKANKLKLFYEKTGEPSKTHLKLIYWAYSPEPDELNDFINKKVIQNTGVKRKETDKSKKDDESSSSTSGNEDPKKAKTS